MFKGPRTKVIYCRQFSLYTADTKSIVSLWPYRFHSFEADKCSFLPKDNTIEICVHKIQIKLYLYVNITNNNGKI